VHYSRVTSLFGAINSLIVQFASFQYLGRKKGKKVRFLFHSRDPEGTISSSWIPFIAYSQQADKQEISSSLSLSLSLSLSSYPLLHRTTDLTGKSQALPVTLLGELAS